MENRRLPTKNLSEQSLGQPDKRQELIDLAGKKFNLSLSHQDMLDLVNKIRIVPYEEGKKIIIELEQKIKQIPQPLDEYRVMLPPFTRTNNFKWIDRNVKSSPHDNYDDVTCYNVTKLISEKFGEPKDNIYLITKDILNVSKLNAYWKNILVRTATAMQDDYENYMKHHKNIPYIIITEQQLEKLAYRNKTIFKLWKNKQDTLPDDVKKNIEENKEFLTLCEPLSKVEKKFFVPTNNLREKKRKTTDSSPEAPEDKLPKTNPLVITDGPAVTRIPQVPQADAALLANFSATASSDPRLFATNNAASNPPQATQSVPQKAAQPSSPERRN